MASRLIMEATFFRESLMLAKISKRTVDAAISSDDQDLWIWDTEVKGFGVRIRVSGRKVYVVEYRPGGGGRKAPKRRFTIGQHGSPWTPNSARDEAKRILGLVKEGRDPSVERTTARERGGDSVAELVSLFIDKYAKVRQRSWRETERVLLRDVIPSFGNKSIEVINRRDVVRLLDDVGERGPIMANRTLSYVRRFFNWCIERGYISDNPCHGIKPPGEIKSRERVLDDVELVTVWGAAESVGGNWAPLVKLLILTAQRRSEVAEMRWSEIDFEEKTWTIPGERTKNKRTHQVPLTNSAIAILQAVNSVFIEDGTGRSSESPFVFTTTGTTPVSGLSKAKKAIDRAIDLDQKNTNLSDEAFPHWTFHDLRRTATTGMARLGIHPHVADAVLNHKEGTIQGVAAIYNRYAYMDERRRAMEAWGDYVSRVLNDDVLSTNIVDINGASFVR